MPYANNKGADQPAYPRSLISAFVVRCLDSIIRIFAKSKIIRLGGLCSRADLFESFLDGNSEDRFSRDEAQLYKSVDPDLDVSHDMTKPTKSVCAQRSLGIRPV